MAQSHAQQDPSFSALAAFGRYWIVALLAAVVSAIAANMFVGVPLGMVVDVLLAIMLVGLVLAEGYLAVRGVGLLISGQLSGAMVWLGAMVIYLLLVFPPVMAFDGYAYFTGQQISGASQLYDTLTGAIAAVFKVPAQIVSALLVVTLNAGSAYVNYVAQARMWLEIGANVLSILVALRALLARRQEHKESAAH